MATVERIFLVLRWRTCSACGHAEDVTDPHHASCAVDACLCRARPPRTCSFDSPPDALGLTRVAHHLKKQGPCEVRLVVSGVLLTPDSGHVKVGRPRDPKPPKVAARAAPQQTASPRTATPKRPARQGAWADSFLDNLEIKVGVGRSAPK